MGQCQKCYSYFPPQYMREIEGAESVDDLQCVYCKSDKDYVMVQIDNGSEQKYTKKQCIKEYKEFINKLRQTPNIAKKLAGEAMK